MPRTYEYHRPADLAQACRLLEDLPEPQLLAGGTDLLYDIDVGVRDAQHVVSLQVVRELGGIEDTNDAQARLAGGDRGRGSLDAFDEVGDHSPKIITGASE